MDRTEAVRRLTAAVVVAAALVLGVTLLPAQGLTAAGDARSAKAYQRGYTDRAQAAVAPEGRELVRFSDGHLHAVGDDGHGHDHGDPATKNDLSRSVEATQASATDPTTEQQAEASVAAAARHRAQADPPLTTARLAVPQPAVPTDRYNMFDQCYAVQSTRTGRWLTGGGGRLLGQPPTFSAGAIAGATPLYFKASHLGRYLLHSPDERFLTSRALRGPAYAARPAERAVWTVTMPSPGRFLLATRDGTLTDAAGTARTTAAGTSVALRRTTGCAAMPEIGTGVTGAPHAGTSPTQETRGFIDAHTHGMAFEFLGGRVHCGRPWSAYGVEDALTDCPDHTLTGGHGAAMEALLSGRPTHDPVGWPTFRDWPAPDSLTHEGTYYRWMERSWRGGQRILVNLLVENNKLCEIYPLKKNSCDEMDSVRLQAQRMRELEAYVDAQYGGPGRGWYRIVTTPTQARRVVNAGKLAVVMGIETSVPFGCTQKLGVPARRCTTASIDRQLDEMRALGVTQMELVNKFDNALSGVAGDEGTTGILVNAANLLETGSAWRMRTCAPNGTEERDKNQLLAAPGGTPEVPAQDALFGAVAQISGLKLPSLPLYPAPDHCNSLGLSPLGEHVIRGLAERHMLFDPDHMSLAARRASLDLVEEMGYSGLLSSHSWSTPDAYARILDLGGFIAPYAGDSAGFVEKWRRHLTWANPETYWGIGFGADINGLGAQGDPRGADTDNPVSYPFTGYAGVRVDKQVSGERVYDVNVDGVAHYGLYPDWIEDLRQQAGDDIVDDLARGPEAYLQMWERAYGVRPNACATGEALTPARLEALARPGMTDWQVLRAIGQPDRRLGATFTYCSTRGQVAVRFDGAGRVVRVAPRV